jgi:hypothetical protein
LTFVSLSRNIESERAMSKPWIIVASACGLMALVVVAKHSRSGNSTGVSPAPKTLEALGSTPRAQRSGWLAVEGGGPAGAAARSGKTGRGADGVDAGGASSPDWGLSGSGGRVASARGGLGASAGYSGSGPISAGANVSADTGLLAGAGQLPGSGHGQSNASGNSTQELVKKTDNSTNATNEDPNGPVLDLPLNGTTEPTKGEAPLLDQNVKCGGVGEGCVFDTGSQFAIPDAANLSGDAGSISFCMQPQWGGTEQSNADLVDLGNTWENRIKLFKNGSMIRFLFWPNSGVEAGVGARIDSWQPGTWHPVTATYGPDPTTGTNMVSLYVDGVMIGQSPYDGQLNVPQLPLYIGANVPAGSAAAQSALMNFQAYDRALAPSEALNFAGNCPQ